MIGRKVGRYEIVSKLGEGGMGSVWRAEDPTLGRSVALKFLPAAASPEARRRFLREARAASKLRHPGIAAVFDAGEQDGEAYIAFELVDGETVSERAARAPLPVRDAVRIAREAAGALAHAHEHGVLHRDVTGGNVMIDREGHARIVDFGLALPEWETRLTQDGATMGTAAYVAPEVIAGKPADARADLYGLAVVLYEMLTGRLPFEGERPEAVLYAAAHEPPRPPRSHRPDLPRDVERVILRTLAKDPADRPRSAGDLLVAMRRLGRRRAPWKVMAGAAAIVALMGLIWQLWTTSGGGGRGYSSVAVLPLQNLSEDPAASGYLSDSIGETLATRFTQLDGLRVIPWVTSMRFSDPSIGASDIAAELGVDALVAGTFRQVEGRIQGSLSLVDANQGTEVWVRRFDEPLKEGFIDVIGSLAVEAGGRLRGGLTRGERDALSRPPAASFEAYDLYLQASDQYQFPTRRSLRRALVLFERAVEIDPTLARAHVGIGSIHRLRYYRGWEGGGDSLDLAEAAFLRALELDPTLTRARGGLVRVHWDQGRAEDCLRQGKEAVTADPEDVDALLVRAEAYTLCGLPDAAIPVAELVLELDPANAGAWFFLSFAAYLDRRYEESVRAGLTFLERFGYYGEVHISVGLSLHSLGRMDEAREHFEAVFEREPELAGIYIGNFYRTTGEPELARERVTPKLEETREMLAEFPDNGRLRFQLCAMLVILGDLEGFRREREEALRLSANNGYLRNELALVHFFVGDVAEGVRLLEEAVDLGWISMGGFESFYAPGVTEHPAYLAVWERTRKAANRLRVLY